MVKGFANRLIANLFPGQCLCCGLPSGRDLDLCASCEGDFQPVTQQCQLCAEPLAMDAICPRCQQRPPPFSNILVPYLYGPPLDRIITGLKHDGKLSGGRVLGALLAKHVLAKHALEKYGEDQQGPLPDCLVAVPLHWRRRLHRGFNQAREIARMVSAQTGIPLANRLVFRVTHTTTQQGQNRGERRKNLRGAFAARACCKGLHIAVIDDVVTTTSTARAISRALMAAGARRVEIWSVARTALEK